MLPASLARLDSALRAALPNIIGCGVFASDPNHSGWSATLATWHTLGSETIRVDWSSAPSAGDITTADGIVAAFDASQSAQDAANNANARTAGVALLSDIKAECKLLRALLLVALDEINILRQRDVDRAADVAASGTLAALKTAWAARAALSDRTANQLRTAITNKINAGDADS